MSAERTGTPCPDLPDTCGAPVGTPCEPWCASQAADPDPSRSGKARPAPAPIEREPRAVRPPYFVPDDRLASIHAAHGTDVWRAAVRLDRVAALREPLHGLKVTDYEHRALDALAGEQPTAVVAVLAGLLHRARAAGPLPDDGPPGIPDRDVER